MRTWFAGCAWIGASLALIAGFLGHSDRTWIFEAKAWAMATFFMAAAIYEQRRER